LWGSPTQNFVIDLGSLAECNDDQSAVYFIHAFVAISKKKTVCHGAYSVKLKFSISLKARSTGQKTDIFKLMKGIDITINMGFSDNVELLTSRLVSCSNGESKRQYGLLR
jgi:hypothetical protein